MSTEIDVRHAHNPAPIGRWIAWALVLALVARALWIISVNPNFQWNVVAEYLSNASILKGLWVTLSLTALSMAIGCVLGLVLAIGKLSENTLARSVSGGYIWLFRGTPLLVQLIFWYNLSSLFPNIILGIPGLPAFASWPTNALITPLTAAIAGLALNEAAYMAEVIRAGLISVDTKQMETAQAFGMSRFRALRRIVIPQAMPAILPPAGNQLISMVKATSLVSVIAMSDLLYSAQTIYNRTFEVVPMLLVAVAWYLVVNTVLSIGQAAIEQYFGGRERVARGAKRRQSTRTGTSADGVDAGVRAALPLTRQD